MKTVIHDKNYNTGYAISNDITVVNIIPYTNGTLSMFRLVEFYYIPNENIYKFRVFDINNKTYAVTYPDSITVIFIYYDK